MKKYLINADVLLTLADVVKDEGQKLIQGLKAALKRGDAILIYHKKGDEDIQNRLKKIVSTSFIDEVSAFKDQKSSLQIKSYETEADLRKLVSNYVRMESKLNSAMDIVVLGQLEDDKIVNSLIDSTLENRGEIKKLSYSVDSFANIQPAIGANIAIPGLQVLKLLEDEKAFQEDYIKIQSAIENDQTREDISKFSTIDMPPLRLDQNLNPIYFRPTIIDADSLHLTSEELQPLIDSLPHDNKLFPTIILSDDPAVKNQFNLEENIYVIDGNKKEALDKFPIEIDQTGMAKIESLNLISNDAQVAGRAHEKYLAAVTSINIRNQDNLKPQELPIKPDYEANVSFSDLKSLTSFIIKSITDNESSIKDSISKNLGETIPKANFVHQAFREAKLSKIAGELELMGLAMGLKPSAREAFISKFIQSYKKYNTLLGERPGAVRSNLTESVFDYIAIGASLMNGLSGLLKGLFPNTAGVAFAGESSSSSIKVGANLLNLYAKLKKFESKGLAVLLKDYNKTLGRLMQSSDRKNIASPIALLEAFMLKSNLTKFSGLASSQSTSDGKKAAFWNVMAAVGSVTTAVTAALKSKDLGIEKANQIAAWGSIASRAVNIYSSLSLFAQDVRIREFLQGIKLNTDKTISNDELNQRLTALIQSPEIKEIINEFEKLKTQNNNTYTAIQLSNEEDIELGQLRSTSDHEGLDANQSLLTPYPIKINPENIKAGTLLTISGKLWGRMNASVKERLLELLKNNKNIHVKIITEIRGTSSVASGEDATLSRLLPYDFKASLLSRFSAGDWEVAHLDKNGNTPRVLISYGLENDPSSPKISRWFQQISQEEKLDIHAISIKFSENPTTSEILHHDFSEFMGYLENVFTIEYINQLKKEQKLGNASIYSESSILPHISKIPSRSEFTERVTILDADNYEIEPNDLSIILEGFNKKRLNHPDKDHYIVVAESTELQNITEEFNQKEKQYIHLIKQPEGIFDSYKNILPLKDRTRMGSISLFTNNKKLTNQAYSNLFGIVNVHTTNIALNNRAQIETSLRDLRDLLGTDIRQNKMPDTFIGKKQPSDLHTVGVKAKIDYLVKMMKVYYNSEELGKKVFKFRDQNISFYNYMKALKKETTASPTQINQLTDRFLLVAAALVVLKQPRLDILPALIGIMGSPKNVYFNNYLKTGKMQSKANKLLAQVFTSSMVTSLNLYPDKSYHYCAQMAIAQLMVEKPQTELMMAAGKLDRKKDKRFTERTAWIGFVAGALGTFVPFGIITRKQKELQRNRRLINNAMTVLNKASSMLTSPETISGLAVMAFNATQSTPDNSQEEDELQKLTTNLNRVTGMVIFTAVIVTVVGNYVQARYFNQKFKDQGRQMDKLDKNLSKRKNQFNKNIQEFIPVVRKRVLNSIIDLLQNVIEGKIKNASSLDKLRLVSQIGIQSKLEAQAQSLIDVLRSSKEILSVHEKETLLLTNTDETAVLTGESFNLHLNSEIEQTILALQTALKDLTGQNTVITALLKEKKQYFEKLDMQNEDNLWIQTDQKGTEEPVDTLLLTSNIQLKPIELGNLGEGISEPSRTLFATDSDILALQQEEVPEITPLFSRMTATQNMPSTEFGTDPLSVPFDIPIDSDARIKEDESVSSADTETRSQKPKSTTKRSYRL